MWYYQTKAGVIGPVEGAEIVRLIEAGEISDSTKVRREGQDNWAEAWQTDRAGYLRTMNNTGLGTNMQSEYSGQPASLWARIGAHFLDAIIVSILASIAGGVFGFVLGILGYDQEAIVKLSIGASLVLVFLYYGIPSGSDKQSTFGMRVLNIRFVRPDGGKVGVIRGGIRPFAVILSALPLYLGLIAALFNRDRITLHDLICGTRVVRA